MFILQVRALEQAARNKSERIQELENDLDDSNRVILELQAEIETQNQKLIQMEETVFEMENIQLDMLNQLKEIYSGKDYGNLFSSDLSQELANLLGISTSDAKHGHSQANNIQMFDSILDNSK